MKNLILFLQGKALLVIFIGLITTGCGSTVGDIAGVGSGGTGSLTKPVSGNVADGYLVNASVFLDKNANYQKDTGEPGATTGANGEYTLQLDLADIGKYPIVAVAARGIAIDRDTNQPVTDTYIFSIHKDSISESGVNFISPFSTLLREMAETGKYGNLSDAKETLRARMGVPSGVDLTGDYIASQNSALHSTAKNITLLIGGDMGQIFNPNGSIDAKRYRNMIGAILNTLIGL